ncbi:MAG: hypothetical protein QY314_04665 [Candidatus Dojkabacteria bacterium]|nr:MAG: hypothetical protein QY314_04665 [Candidatus Dojkabacteria bacterium]
MFIPTYHYNLFAYLGTKRTPLPKNIAREFYLSWEDALWDLLKAKRIPKGSKVLVPSFHCLDVMNNIAAHGYPCETYEVDRNFATTPQLVLEAQQKHNAKVIVVFHTLGIKNSLFQDTSWINQLPKDVIIIEDAVHRVIEPSRLTILGQNHFILDSLRKVTPLQGSFIYGLPEALDYKKTPTQKAFWYQLKGVYYFVKFQCMLSIAAILQSPKIVKKAEKVLTVHDDHIGDNEISGRNFGIFSFFQRFLDFKKIRKIKHYQATHYENRLFPMLEQSKSFFRITVSEEDKSELRGYPIGLEGEFADEVLAFLRENDVLLTFHLKDCEWCQNKKVIFLPMGPHINMQQVEYVCSVIEKYCVTQSS